MMSKYKSKGIVVGLSVITMCVLLALIGSRFSFLFQQQSNSATKTVGNSTSKTAIMATPTPTSTAFSTPQPLFFDNFANASKGWSLGNVPGYTRSIALLQANNDDSVGLYLRGDSNLDHDYRIDIFGDSSYAISKEFLDRNNTPQVKALVSQTKTDALHPTRQQNNVTVTMKGSMLVLQINGNFINSVVDTDYTTGQLALFVQNSNLSGGVKASFSSVAVYPAPQQLPSN